MTEERLREDIRRVETYIAEHGQEAGTVSWQMARDSFNAINHKLESLAGALGQTVGVLDGTVCAMGMARIVEQAYQALGERP